MKKLTIIGIMAAGALLFASCDKDPKGPEGPKDPGKLVAFGFYQADNKKVENITVPPAEEGGESTTEEKISDQLSLDYVGTISANMSFVLPDSVRTLANLKARYEIKENNVIKINGTDIKPATTTGTFVVDAFSPIDIIVTDTLSNRSTAYVVDFKNGIGYIFKKVAEYTENNTELSSDLNVAVNPKDGKAYIAYIRKDTTTTYKEDGTTKESKNNQVSVIKWNGSAFDVVGNVGFSGPATNKAATVPVLDFDSNGVPYVAFADGQLSLARVMKFNGTAWENVGGDAGFGEKPSSYEPAIFVNPANNNPVALYSSNLKNGGSYYRTAFVGTFNGSTWDVAGLASAPTPSTTNSDNMYYRSKTVKIGNIVYMLSAFNGTKEGVGGFYLYKYEDSAFSLVGKSFVGTSHGGGMSLKADAQGNLYAVAAVKEEDTYCAGLYTVSKEDGSMTKVGGTIGTMGNMASVYYDVLADGDKTYTVFKDSSSFPKFGVIGSEGVWSDFVSIDSIEIKNKPIVFKADGKVYAAIMFRNASTKKNNIALYEIVAE